MATTTARTLIVKLTGCRLGSPAACSCCSWSSLASLASIGLFLRVQGTGYRGQRSSQSLFVFGRGGGDAGGSAFGLEDADDAGAEIVVGGRAVNGAKGRRVPAEVAYQGEPMQG